MNSRVVVVLGASNVWLSLPWLLPRLAARGDTEVFLACGPGRSYARRAGTVAARYHGLLECALFEVLERRLRDYPRQLEAFVCDVGNDLIYESPADQVVGWVSQVFDRLQALQARVRLVDVPYRSLSRLPAPFYYLFRTLYYSNCRVSYAAMMERLADLHGGLGELCQRRGVELLALEDDWFSFDRFHFSPARCGEIWRRWLGGPEPQGRPWLSTYALEPSHYWFFGREQHRPPRISLGGLSLYRF